MKIALHNIIGGLCQNSFFDTSLNPLCGPPKSDSHASLNDVSHQISSTNFTLKISTKFTRPKVIKQTFTQTLTHKTHSNKHLIQASIKKFMQIVSQIAFDNSIKKKNRSAWETNNSHFHSIRTPKMMGLNWLHRQRKKFAT